MKVPQSKSCFIEPFGIFTLLRIQENFRYEIKMKKKLKDKIFV